MTIEEYLEHYNVGKESLEAENIREGYEFAKKESPWISVKEGLPNGGKCLFASYEADEWHYSFAVNLSRQSMLDWRTLRYWMPIPELPKED